MAEPETITFDDVLAMCPGDGRRVVCRIGGVEREVVVGGVLVATTDAEGERQEWVQGELKHWGATFHRYPAPRPIPDEPSVIRVHGQSGTDYPYVAELKSDGQWWVAGGSGFPPSSIQRDADRHGFDVMVPASEVVAARAAGRLDGIREVWEHVAVYGYPPQAQMIRDEWPEAFEGGDDDA